ncbi:hypothetical protein SHIRM173S_00733 [Streptomyces hirsutus]
MTEGEAPLGSAGSCPCSTFEDPLHDFPVTSPQAADRPPAPRLSSGFLIPALVGQRPLVGMFEVPGALPAGRHTWCRLSAPTRSPMRAWLLPETRLSRPARAKDPRGSLMHESNKVGPTIAPVPETEPGRTPSPAGEQHLSRQLSNRHIQLIAIGGAIGTGLFMGSGKTISLAGPSVIFVYMIIGAMLFFVMRAMESCCSPTCATSPSPTSPRTFSDRGLASSRDGPIGSAGSSPVSPTSSRSPGMCRTGGEGSRCGSRRSRRSSC